MVNVHLARARDPIGLTFADHRLGNVADELVRETDMVTVPVHERFRTVAIEAQEYHFLAQLRAERRDSVPGIFV